MTIWKHLKDHSMKLEPCRTELAYIFIIYLITENTTSKKISTISGYNFNSLFLMNRSLPLPTFRGFWTPFHELLSFNLLRWCIIFCMYKVKVQLKIKTKFHCLGHCIARTTSNQYSKFQVSSTKKSRGVWSMK